MAGRRVMGFEAKSVRACALARAGLPVLVAGAILLGACVRGAGKAPRLRAEDYPGVLVEPSRIAGDFLWRQSVTATFTRADGSTDRRQLDAVVQKRGGVLSLLGLSPFGARAFLIEQRGQAVTLQRFLPGELPILPRFVLVDLHRTYFRAAGGAAPDAQPDDGERVTEGDGERQVDRYAGGQLVERRFTRLDGRPKGAIRIAYAPGLSASPGVVGPPRSVTLINEWFGYRLDIETVQHTPLPPSD